MGKIGYFSKSLDKNICEIPDLYIFNGTDLFSVGCVYVRCVAHWIYAKLFARLSNATEHYSYYYSMNWKVRKLIVYR